MRTLVCALLLCVCFVVSAAHFPRTEVSADPSMPPPPADQAQIVFLRPSGYFPGMLTLLFEGMPDAETFIAPIGGRNKVVYNTAPGRKYFASALGGSITHYLDAEVEAGRRYYVLVRPIHGYGFQLRPIRHTETDYSMANPDFPQWLAKSVRVQAAEGERFNDKFKAAVDKARLLGFTRWQEKTAGERAELTLSPADAVAP